MNKNQYLQKPVFEMKVDCAEWCRREKMPSTGNWFSITVTLEGFMKCAYWSAVVTAVVCVVNKTCCVICVCVYTCICHLITLNCFSVCLQFYLQLSIDWVMQKTRCVENKDGNLFRKKNVKTLHKNDSFIWGIKCARKECFFLASGKLRVIKEMK